LWIGALKFRRPSLAGGFGVFFAVALFISPIFLGLGVFLATFTLLYFLDDPSTGPRRVVREALIALVTFALPYVVLYCITGFNPIQTFLTINGRQAADLVNLARPYPAHIPFDFLDFALGAGWIGYLLAGFYLVTLPRRRPLREPLARLAMLGVIQITVVGAAAFLPGESVRLWLPFFPLLIIPIAAELQRWTPGSRQVVYMALWLITTVLAQNMIFNWMGTWETTAQPAVAGFAESSNFLAQASARAGVN
jgi:hypothetical protein